MGIQEAAQQALPPPRPQYLFKNREAAQQEILDVIVDERSVYLHALRFDSLGKGIGLWVSDMRCERILKALEFRKRGVHV